MAQTAEEALVVRLEATLTRFERQMQRAKQVAEGTSVGMERRFDKAAKNMAATADRASASVTRLGNAGSGMGRQIQNASYQIGDFAVQVAGGTDPMRAMAQQLPQLLGGLGVFGAVAGAAAAVVAPLASSIFGASDSAKALDDAMKSLSSSVDAYVAASEAANVSSDDLREKYGSMAREAQAALSAMSDAAYATALSEMAGVIASVKDNLMETREYQNSMLGGTESVLALKDSYGMTADEVGRVREAITALLAAEGLPETAAAALDVQDALIAAHGSVNDMPPALQTVFTQMASIAERAATIQGATEAATTSIFELVSATAAGEGGIAAMADQASRLASAAATAAQNIWAAAQARVDANKRLAEMQFEFSPGGQALMKYGGRSTTSDKPVTNGDGLILRDGQFVDPNARISRGGGGGGKDPVDQAAQKYQRLIATLDPLARAEQQFAEAQATVNDALAKGVITSEEAARATALMGEEYAQAIAKANDAGDGFAKINDQLKDSILDLAADGVNSFDQLAAAIKRAAFEALLFGSGPMSGLFGGGSGLLGGLFGGAAGSVASTPIAAAPKLAPKVAALATSRSGAAQISVNVSGARGNAEIESMVAQGVRSGIAQYDRQALPMRIKQISADGRRIG